SRETAIVTCLRNVKEHLGGARRAAEKLPGESACVEKRLLFRVRRAPEHKDAVGKTAEPANDVGVDLRESEVFGSAAGAKQLNATVLIRQPFGMHEGHIEEFDKVGLYARVGAAGDG